MNKTKIPFCDYTWNPIVGCSPCSPGCDHCYAKAISHRFNLPWGKAHFMPERLNEPYKIRKPARIFVCSMSDIGHPTVESKWKFKIYEAMVGCPQHNFILLTKRPENIWADDLPKNVLLGVSICTQAETEKWKYLFYGRLWDSIQRTLFVSVEPMLEAITFRQYYDMPDWVIAGPETGPGARPCDQKWIEDLAAESKCFFDKRQGVLKDGHYKGRRWEFPTKKGG